MIQNITPAFYQEVLNMGLKTSKILKIIDTVKTLIEQNISINYRYEPVNQSHMITLLCNAPGAEIGYFMIGKNRNTLTMNISVDVEYQNMGLSRIMVASMILYLVTEPTPLHIRKDQLLFIDTDASWRNGLSFWDHIGMTECRFYKLERESIRKMPFDGAGYEKKITFQELSIWTFGTNLI